MGSLAAAQEGVNNCTGKELMLSGDECWAEEKELVLFQTTPENGLHNQPGFVGHAAMCMGFTLPIF